MKIVMLNNLNDAHYLPFQKKKILIIGKYQLEIRYLNLKKDQNHITADIIVRLINQSIDKLSTP